MFAAGLIAIRTVLAMTILTGIIFPVLIYGVGALLFKQQANGSLITKQGQIVGSELLAQKFESNIYFYSRPSASEFVATPSGASNLGPTSAALKDILNERREQNGAEAPADLLTASGSGLDPHLSPEAVVFQIDRVASARGLNEEKTQEVRRLIDTFTEQPQLGLLGARRVNVLKLNLALDDIANEP
jgi:K+-transporting ATPase ATPase C chain